MFRIEALPAQRGDALWLTYGNQRKPRHVLIDAGPKEALDSLLPILDARFAALPPTDGLELLVVTHVDVDHIQGILKLLDTPDKVRRFREIWFNGLKHHKSQLLGVRDGEQVTQMILAGDPQRWNASFGGDAVVAPSVGKLPSVKLPGGLKVTILAPTPKALARLVPSWEKIVEDAESDPVPETGWKKGGLLGGGFDPDALARLFPDRLDGSAQNGASISFLAEYRGKRVLLLADSPAAPIIDGLDRLGTGPIRVDAVKMSHHGSLYNTTLPLLRRITSPRWIVSSNGATHGHPDYEALARVIVTQDKPTFYLNYETSLVKTFVDAAGPRFSVVLPPRLPDGTRAQGVAVDL
ncbi:MAG TPA: hypothetical protein VLR88_08020 [Propionibacteriaceae bacterium]|nr:hypothetical protein [Propionibacteriaceae bacterium]